ncbi:cytochrome oxidase assembly protein [Halobacteriales archaeon QS_1_68_20]|nr:MAG: cytochrome oxidase assembly protein [Halobacteriales archaeon QS_1_68_20]
MIAVTTTLVVFTVLLGVATKATGAGLACQARWPVCDGGFLNLFPQSFPSFFEWIHRVVAGVAGVAILGTGWLAWRGGATRRVRWAVTIGTLLLPVQVLLGRETVLTYEIPILAAHFWVAFTIFASFTAATVTTWRPALTPGRLQVIAATGAVLVPAQVLLYPPFVTGLTPPVQTLQYAVTLAAFMAAIAVGVAAREYLDGRLATVALALPVLHPLVVLAGRQLLDPSGPVFTAYTLVAAALAGGLLWVALRVDRR